MLMRYLDGFFLRNFETEKCKKVIEGMSDPGSAYSETASAIRPTDRISAVLRSIV